jgi:hypothetical protein
VYPKSVSPVENTDFHLQIKSCNLPLASNLVLVMTSDGSLRLYNDHRGVNRKTTCIKDAHSLPRISVRFISCSTNLVYPKSVGPVENTDFHLQIKSCNLPLVLGVKCFKSISSFFLNVTCIGFFTF